MLYKIIKTLFILFAGGFVKGVMARDRDFDPMTSMELLTIIHIKVLIFIWIDI